MVFSHYNVELPFLLLVRYVPRFAAAEDYRYLKK